MRGTRGFTLIEVMIALVLLSVALLGMASVTGSIVRTAVTSDQATTALQLAEDRIEQVRLEPAYGRLDTLYAGTESSLPGFPGFSRQTRVTRISSGTPPAQFTRITVTVQGPGLLRPVTRTVTVAKP